ncbi:uncharacterized protein K452DRAFT_278101 [Aplosporella prunicola CBS 121167]|uniref:DUF7587 domain-containing protein n=1 Tax=Aplosporella prunicola CBS 121167 TaxID=1176127 RepID=A0A6A6B2Y6_9PEZI|nr:uncharacterized protein K452DRAFT_278101 [Aplosporella prunicola CBS 121167]KAF2137743.1 hypothetical protein K452DRAFT_278101 [Aplosporella prunicola CBS 121167]
MAFYVQPSLQDLRAHFAPHQFGPNERLTLYHVYDNLSQTPLDERGIECGDPNILLVNPWHVITVDKIKDHLDWSSRNPTQFISFYNDKDKAIDEANRRREQRWVYNGEEDRFKKRYPEKVRIAVVELEKASSVWVFSREDLKRMLGSHPDVFYGTHRPGHNEWFVWGHVPRENVAGYLSPPTFGEWIYHPL